MANDSVSATGTNESPVGWRDLLIENSLSTQRFDKRELGRISGAADSMIHCLCDGLEAIGELQWRAYSDPLNSPGVEVAFNLGAFQSVLARLVSELRLIESNANFGLRSASA